MESFHDEEIQQLVPCGDEEETITEVPPPSGTTPYSLSERIRFQIILSVILGVTLLGFFAGMEVEKRSFLAHLDSSANETSLAVKGTEENSSTNYVPQRQKHSWKDLELLEWNESILDGLQSDIESGQIVSSEGQRPSELDTTESPTYESKLNFSSDFGLSFENLSDEDSWSPFYHIHIPYRNHLRYRRVCALVHSSHLCLTIRFPFEIDTQDSGVNYAKPVQELFYEDEIHVDFIDGKRLSKCRESIQNSGSVKVTAASAKECIEGYHGELGVEWQTTTAVALWTHHREGNTELFGIDFEAQRGQMHQYFKNNALIVLGASPTPAIAGSFKRLFSECRSIDDWDGMLRGDPVGNFGGMRRNELLCYPSKDSSAHTASNWEDLDFADEWTLVLYDNFYPNDLGHGFYNHSITPGTTVATELEKIMGISNLTSLDFTVIVEHPIAHIQNQDLMEKSYDYIASMQTTWPEVFLNATKGEAYESLVDQGIGISNVIAFDGSPQFFPTESGGYTGKIHSIRTEEDFLEKDGYEGWIPDYGSRCRGFLPPTSNLTQFNSLGRSAYESNPGFDTKWYGRTWEFLNLVWFTVKGTSGGWGSKGLDCTHGLKASSAISQIHKFFLLAMVEDEIVATRR